MEKIFVRKFWLPIVLAWAAGFVDSLGFLALSHEFTSHMSGNAAATGAELGVGNFHEALVLGSAIPGFVAGVCLGVAADIIAKRKQIRSPFGIVLLMESACLIAFMAVAATQGYPVAKGSGRFFVLVECLTIAMGLQAAALRRVQDIKVSTTFVTGMITSMAEEFTNYVLSPKNDAGRAQSGTHALLFASIFLAFVIGGVGGAFGHQNCGPYALVAPLVVVLVIAAKQFVSERRDVAD